MNADPRRRIPRTDDVLADPRVADAAVELGWIIVKEAVHQTQERARAGRIAPEEVIESALAALPRHPSSLRPVINATGVMVHTNLGRAPLSQAARSAVMDAAGTTDVEFDLATGTRGRRGGGVVAALVDAVPSAGSAHVVNNNAAALLLCALTLAPGREIVLGRGEMVEIGDGFRIPELLASTGARLREVGTTNRTALRDYLDAIGPETGMVLKVHPSNFEVTGFTSSVGVAELAGPLADLDVPLVVDIGSGLLAHEPMLPDEPDAGSALREGATMVTASADKLLGGPQAGLLLGKAPLLEQLRRHPAARALRVDKLTLAALEATLTGPTPPVTTSLTVSAAELRERVKQLARRVAGVDAHVVPTRSVVGGGGAPGVEIDSVALSLPEWFAEQLRSSDPPVVGRIDRRRCLLDPRTVDPADDERLGVALEAVVMRCTS